MLEEAFVSTCSYSVTFDGEGSCLTHRRSDKNSIACPGYNSHDSLKNTHVSPFSCIRTPTVIERDSYFVGYWDGERGQLPGEVTFDGFMMRGVLDYVGYAEGMLGLELSGEDIDRTQERVRLVDDPIDRVGRKKDNVLGERWKNTGLRFILTLISTA